MKWRAIGETFTYLGRTCVVTGYLDLCSIYMPPRPCLHANYADELGVIHQITFNLSETFALMKQQEKIS